MIEMPRGLYFLAKEIRYTRMYIMYKFISLPDTWWELDLEIFYGYQPSPSILGLQVIWEGSGQLMAYKNTEIEFRKFENNNKLQTILYYLLKLKITQVLSTYDNPLVSIWATNSEIVKKIDFSRKFFQSWLIIWFKPLSVLVRNEISLF